MIRVGAKHVPLNKSGYDDVTIPVSVSTCETTPRHVVLTGYGSLYISSDPSGASVYLDGEYVGETPCTSGEIKEGSHFITLTKYRYKNVTKMTQVSAGITTPVSIDLSYVLWIYGIIFGIISTVGVVAFVWLRKTGRVPKWVIEGKVPWWAVVILVAAALTQIIKSLLSLL